MAETTKDEVLAALRAVKGPDQQRDIVSAGMVRSVAVCDGIVGVDIALPPCDEQARKFIQSHATNVLKVLDGVKPDQLRVSIADEPADAASQQTGEDSGIPGVRHIISIGSGKGGVGKSTVAVNLAVSLARKGHAVGLLDTDVYGPSIPLMLGRKEMPRTEGQMLIPLEAHGIKFMSMGLLVPDDKPVIWRGPMLHGAVQQFLKQVAWDELDYLFVDLPPGTGDVHLSLVQSVKLAGAVVVSTPQAVSLLDATKALKMFQETGARVLGMIENMSYYICPGCERRDYIFGRDGVRKAAEALQVPLLGEIPLITKIRQTGDEGTPIVAADPDSPAAQAFETVTANLVAQISRDLGGPARGALRVK